MAAQITSDKKKSSYFTEVKNELKKVTWTSRGELIFCTKTVIFSTFFFGLAIYGVDLTIRGVLDGISATLRMIFG